MNTINLRLLNSNQLDYPIWHPYMNINNGYDELLNISDADECYLYDVNGKEYLDATSGLWNVSLGYSNNAIKESIVQQLNKMPYCSLFEHTNQTAVLAAHKILGLFDASYKKVFFTCTGSESVELSVKLMRKYWKLLKRENKLTILTLNHSYHGTYYASLSASNLEKDLITDYKPMVPNFLSLPPGICSKCKSEICDLSCMKETESFLQNNYDSIAGIIIEPILASNGVQMPGSNFLKALCKLCSLYEIIITFDEVATGFFRTGTAFYFQQLSVQPDLICLSKGINSGYLPQGAVVIKDSLIPLFSGTSDILVHGSTQNGNLLSCAATIAAIDQYVEKNIEKNVCEKGKILKDQLKKKLGEHENIKEIRGVGLMLEIELTKGGCKTEIISAYAIIQIQRMLLQKGLLVYRSDFGLTLLPMLNIVQGQADDIIQIICDVFSNILI